MLTREASGAWVQPMARTECRCLSQELGYPSPPQVPPGVEEFTLGDV